METGQTELDDYVDAVGRAQQPDLICFSNRHPFATDAYELGYAPGVNVDTSGYQAGDYPNVDLPVAFVDHDYRDPDRAAIVRAVDQYEPPRVVIGDAYDIDTASELDTLAAEIRHEYSDVEPIIVPKCGEAFDVLDEATVVGYPAGYSKLSPADYSTPVDWRGRRVHVLGGSPPTQYDAIQQLTQPTLDGQPPADIVSIDSNCYAKVAYKGEYWSRTGWQSADHLSIRETVRKSLREAREFYQDNGLWPATDPREVYGPAVLEPTEDIFMDQGGDPITSREGLEKAYIAEDEDGWTYAFASESQRDFVAYREGWGQRN